MRGFTSLVDLPEDDRIVVIVREAKSRPGHVLGVVVDDQPPEKSERYQAKLRKAGVVVLDARPGPVRGSIIIRVTAQAH